MVKFKKLLLPLIAGTFLGSACLLSSCSAMMEEDPPCTEYNSTCDPVIDKDLDTVMPSSIILPKRPASKEKKKSYGTIKNFLRKQGSIDKSIQEAKQVSSEFYDFARASTRGFADRINQEYKSKNCYNQKCRCSKCGWIGFPKRNSAGPVCRGCHSGGGVGERLLFQIFNGNPTTRFGICPYSTAENPHFGFIYDMRIVQCNKNAPRYEGLELGDLKHDDRTRHCWFYCYDCGKNVAVPLNTLGGQ